MTAIERIVVRAPNWIGDVVLSLPAVRDLRRNFPAARIEVLARPWVAELYRAVAEVDAVRVERAAVRADAAARARRVRRRACCCRTRSASALAVWTRRHPRALGLRHRRPRARCSRARPRVPRAGPGPQPGVLLSGDAGGGRSPRLRRHPTRRSRCPPEWAARGGRAPRRRRAVDRPQPRRVLRHRQALAARALRGGRATRWPGARARGSPSWAAPPSGRSARPSPRGMRAPARVLCGETTPGGAGRRAVAPARCWSPTTPAPCTWRPPWACPWWRCSAPPTGARRRRSATPTASCASRCTARPAGCASARSTIAA